VRAVGNALAHNPIGFVVPCHRVIRATGVLGDYRWGRLRRRAMAGPPGFRWPLPLRRGSRRLMDFRRILREGFVAGLIGAASVATWFLLVDLVAGRAFFTPAMLGDALFWGVRDPGQVQIAFPSVVGYTMVHMLAFVVVGMVAAFLAYEVELFPHALFIVVVFFVYDGVMRALGKQESVAVGVLCAILLAVLIGLSRVFTGRALFIHAGMLMGTVMAMNVWMRIWPAQRKIIQGVKGVAPAPDASIPAMATARSKQNTYMSVALLFTMVSNHYPTIYGSEYAWIVLAVIIAIAFAVTKLLYLKSAGPAPALYGAPVPAPSGGAPGMAAPKA
jgi:hypothetical protein